MSQPIFKSFDPKDENQVPNIYDLLVIASSPRPIAWIVTTNEDNTSNIAPFSFSFVASANPPIVGFCPLKPKSGKQLKDTVVNARRTGEFTFNIVTESNMHFANESSVDLPYGESEADYVGIPLVDSVTIQTKRIAISPIGLECVVPENGIITLGNGPLAGTIVLGQIQHINIDESVLNPDGLTVNPSLLHIVGRMGGPNWVNTEGTFVMPNKRTPWK